MTPGPCTKKHLLHLEDHDVTGSIQDVIHGRMTEDIVAFVARIEHGRRISEVTTFPVRSAIKFPTDEAMKAMTRRRPAHLIKPRVMVGSQDDDVKNPPIVPQQD